MINRDLPEANLALQVDLHVSHAEIEFVNVSCQLIVHQPSFVLGQSKVDNQLCQTKSLIINHYIQDRPIAFIFYFYVVDEKWKFFDDSQLKFIMNGLVDDISISMGFGRHEQVLVNIYAEGQDVIQIIFFDFFKQKLSIILGPIL